MSRIHRTLAVALGTSMLVLAGSADATVRYVNRLSTTHDDCTSRVDPCRYLATALRASEPGDEIRIARGFHTMTGVISHDADVVIRGGYDLDFLSRTRERGGNTILSGLNLHLSGGARVTIDTLWFDGPGESFRPAIEAYDVERLRLVNSIVSGYHPYGRTPGGGLYVVGAWEGTTKIVIDHSEIVDNSAIAGGGLFACSYGMDTIVEVTVKDSVIARNRARGDNKAWSSACGNDTDQAIASNGAYGAGGGILLFAGAFARATLDLIQATIVDNSATKGGGVFARSGPQNLICNGCGYVKSEVDVEVTNSIVRYNDAPWGGLGEDLMVRGTGIQNWNELDDHLVQLTLRSSSVGEPYIKSAQEPVSTYLDSHDPIGAWGADQEFVDFEWRLGSDPGGDYRLSADSVFRESGLCTLELNPLTAERVHGKKRFQRSARNIDGERRRSIKEATLASENDGTKEIGRDGTVKVFGCDIGAY